MADKGLLGLHDPISKYLKITKADVGKITIHQLLTHSSGINEVIGKQKGFSIVDSLNSAALKFTPGSDFEYSNSGFVTLAKIAEVVTGKSYAELLDSEVVAPAHLTRTGVATAKMIGTEFTGYADVAQSKPVMVDFAFENVNGAGSVYSTTPDLYKLHEALNGDSLLSPRAKALMFKPQIEDKYGYGWFVRERGGVMDTYYHKGNIIGYTAFISRRTKADQVIILLTNTENDSLGDMEKDIAKILK